MKKAVVSNDDDGIRLDRWFKRHIGVFKLSELYRCIREKNIKLNGKKTSPSERLNIGDEILYPETFGACTMEEKQKQREALITNKEREYLNSLILYRDKYLIAINKPAGLAVQGGTGQKKYLDNMLSAFMESEKTERPRLVHRLDKETSGVLLLARSAFAATWLTRAFKDKDIRKTYYALLNKRVKAGEGVIKAPLKKAMIGRQELMVVDKKEGLEAITKYQVLVSNENASLVKFMPLTGRTHQLRAHAKHIGHAILGDIKYFGDKVAAEKEKHLMLHAKEILVPDGEKYIKISAPLPVYMIQRAKELGLDLAGIDIDGPELKEQQ